MRTKIKINGIYLRKTKMKTQITLLIIVYVEKIWYCRSTSSFISDTQVVSDPIVIENRKAQSLML
jgi:hypothetical protein